MGGKNKSKQQSNSQQASTGQNVNSGMGVNFGMNQSGQNSNSSGSSFNSSQSSQDVWGGQSPYLEDVYGSAQGQYGQAIGQINDLQPQVQDQVSGALNQAQGGYSNQLGGGFASGLQGQVGPSALVDPVANDLMSDAAKIKQQNLGGIDARAAAAGMSGSSGYHNQVGNMVNDVDESTMQQLNSLRFNAQNQGIQNQMNLAGMQDRNQQAGMANMGNMQQGAMNQFNPAMAGLNATGAYGQIIGGPTVLGQSSSSGGSSQSSSSQGFSNGMNVGMNMNGSQGFNNSAGGSSGNGSSSGWNIAPPSFSFA